MGEDSIYLGAFAGAAGCLFVLNLVLARLARDPRFLIVNIAVISFACSFLLDRHGLERSWNLSQTKAWMLGALAPLLISLTCLSLVLRAAMNLKEASKRLDRLMLTAIVVLAFGIIGLVVPIPLHAFGPAGMDTRLESHVPIGFAIVTGITVFSWLTCSIFTPLQAGELRLFSIFGVLFSAAFLATYCLVIYDRIPLDENLSNGMRLAVLASLGCFMLALYGRSRFVGQQRSRDATTRRIQASEWSEKQASHQAISQAHLMQVLKREKELEAELRKREVEQIDALKAAKEAADEMARNKAQFLAFMSHEIRTPLNGIMGMVHLLMNTEVSEQQRDYIQTLNYSGDALLALVNDTLDISKIEAGQLTLESIDFDLQRLISSIIMLMSARASEKGLLIRSDIGQYVPRFIKGDPTRLRQILLNLINNAIKFTEQGGVTVKARVMDRSAEGKTRLRIDVQDTGPGISAEGRERLFKEYSQVHSSTTRLHGGTGLGLSICKQLVQAMNGEIGVDSTIGEGSSFWFVLDFIETTEDSLGEMSVKAPGTPVLSAMVIEDNDIHQKVIGGYLRLDGHKVTLVGSAEEGLEQLAQHDFDVLLMDVNLPGIDGNEATRRIRAMSNPIKQSVPIIAITGNTSPPDIDECRQAGMDDFVGKPVDPDALRATVLSTHKAWLAKRAATSRPITGNSVGAAADHALHILIVDDNQINQKVIAGFLKAAGHQIDVAISGEKAVALAGATRFDVIFMDVNLPGISGLDASRQIRALPDPQFNTVPIVAITGNTDSTDRDACYQAGMNDFLGKPIDPASLDGVIDRVRALSFVAQPFDSLDDYLPSEPTEREMLDDTVLTRLAKAFNLTALSALMGEMIVETKPIIASMHMSLRDEDRISLRAQAHTLKGMAMTLGVIAVGELSADIESSVQRGTPVETLTDMVDKLEAIFALSCKAIEHWREQHVAETT